MKNTILSLAISALVVFTSFCQGVSNQVTVPMADCNFDNVDGYIVLITGDTLKGKISYQNYGSKTIYYMDPAKADQKRVKPKKFEKYDSLTCMMVNNHMFYAVTTKPGYKALLEKLEDNNTYTTYQSFSSNGIISGPGIVGTYYNAVLIKNTGQVYFENSVPKLSKEIGTIITNCPLIVEKVKAEEKGYKTSLIYSNYRLLIQCLNFVNNGCKE